MHAWVRLTRDGEELGQGWWWRPIEGRSGGMLELKAYSADIDDPGPIWLECELGHRKTMRVGDSAEVEKGLGGLGHRIEVIKVYLDYDDTLESLPSVEEIVLYYHFRSYTTDDEINEIVKEQVRRLQTELGAEPDSVAIKYALNELRIIADSLYSTICSRFPWLAVY